MTSASPQWAPDRGTKVTSVLDLILTLAGVQRDAEGRLLPDFEEHKMIAWIITAAGFGVSILASAMTQIFAYLPTRVMPMFPWWFGQ